LPLLPISGAGLLGALAHFGLDGIGAVEKDEMRDLVLRGGPWTDTERAAILDYCESDVAALARLLPAMLPTVDLRAPSYVAATCRRRREWRTPVFPLTSIRSHCCDVTGRTSRTN
jgi:hypothetical protein